MDMSTHGIVALVQNAAGKFLLLEDSREPMKGCYAPPHGRCTAADVSENAAIIREVKEETGLTIKPLRKVLTQPADTKVKTVSFWIVTSTDSEPTLNEESASFGWYSLDEVLKLKLYPGTRLFFERIKAGEIVL